MEALTAFCVLATAAALSGAGERDRPVRSEEGRPSVTVPVVLDHNRLLVDAQVRRLDGSWRPARLWIDTGNPDLFLDETLARDLGLDPKAVGTDAAGSLQEFEVPAPAGLRIGGMPLDLRGVTAKVLLQPRWLFSTMHNDANLPSTVLCRYDVVFDYPALRLTIAAPGSLEHRGQPVEADVHPATGIVQVDAVIGGEGFSFALDIGASYCFADEALVTRLSRAHPEWPTGKGALGCANIWGWWPGEEAWPLVRLPEVGLDRVRLSGVGLAGLPRFFPGGLEVGSWYSQKTARPVSGFLGTNAFQSHRVEIDYANERVYLERGLPRDGHDMDLVGLTLRPLPDGRYQVLGVAEQDGRRAAGGVEAGDTLLRVDDLAVTGATMGTVVDALRGRPGDLRTLVLEREGRQLTVEAPVRRFL